MRTAVTITAVAVACTVGALAASADAQEQSSNGRLPKIYGVTVSDINDRGQVVGSLKRDYDGASRGFVWKQGSLKVLGRGQFASAHEINERGQILGTSGDDERGVLWENGKMLKLGLTGLWALNNRGDVLGGNLVAVGDNGYAAAPALWTNGAVRLLPFAPGKPTAL